jgi:hypothetical protein
MLLAFDEEACKGGSVRRIAAALSYYVNQEIPGASLARVRKRADDQLTSFFVAQAGNGSLRGELC